MLKYVVCGIRVEVMLSRAGVMVRTTETFSREKVDFRNFRPCGNFEKTDVGYLARHTPHPSRLRRDTKAPPDAFLGCVVLIYTDFEAHKFP